MFRRECGRNYCHKMEVMIRDLHVSKGLNQQFQDHMRDKPHEFALNVRVLTTGNWSNAGSDTNCALPP